MMAGASVVCVEEALGSPVLTVTIHVTDNANLSPTELAGAQAYATAAYRAAGIRIVWSSAPWKPEEGQSAGPPSIDVRVVIAPADMAEKKCREENLGDSVLGVAISGASELRGRIVYVSTTASSASRWRTTHRSRAGSATSWPTRSATR